MKYSIIYFLLSITLRLSATTYYISPVGSDSNSGSSTSPWKTLSYACSRVTFKGDIIHVIAGTYTETKQCNLAEGISLVGDGANVSIIKSNNAGYNEFLILESSVEGTNGNQTISGIAFDGNDLVGKEAIKVRRRSNVKIHDCTFTNFKYSGVTFKGQTEGSQVAPTVWAKGNEFFNNIIINCSIFEGYAYGALIICGQDGLLIHHNTISQLGRAQGSNGDCISFLEHGWNRGVKIYNNEITCEPYFSNNFAIELWNVLGGFEIYNNTIRGTIDFLHLSKGAYEHSLELHDNIIGPETQPTKQQVGLWLETENSDLIVRNNYFRNNHEAIRMDTYKSGEFFNNINIYSNIFDGLSFIGSNSGKGIFINAGVTSNTFSNINIWNNTFNAKFGTANTAVWLPGNGMSTKISIRNNIIFGFTSGPPVNSSSGGSLNTISIENNCFYGCGNSNNPSYGSITPTNLTTANNLKANPLFVSATDFHLQSTSPCIAAGINIGLTVDYSGNLLKNPPSIGAYESGSSVPPPVVTIPIYQSSAVANGAPSLVELTYDLSLNSSIIPAISSFKVMVNSISVPVPIVAVSGIKVQLTLSSAIKFGDIITLSYTKPATNPLQTPSGGQAASLSASVVANNVIIASPVYVSSAIENATPALLEITYNQTLASIAPAASSFTVMVNSVARSVSAVAISGNKVRLTLTSPVIYGNTVTVAYSKPSTNPLQVPAGGLAAAFTGQTVTNNVAGIIPVYLSSAIENATPSLIEITYSQTLANIIPAASSFTVMVNSVARSVSTVAISGNKVRLTLTSPVIYGNTVTVAYSKPSTNPLQVPAGGLAAAFTGQTVTNNVAGIIPVYLSSAIENATPSLLEITYSQTLAKIIPAASSFTVMVNSIARTVNSVTITGSKVQLTLSSPVSNGNVVSFNYNKPISNPIQTSSGTQAITISAQAVNNKVIGASPTYVSSVIENATPSVLEITYNQSLTTTTPAISAFNVIVNSAIISINSVSVSGTKVMLTLTSRVFAEDNITVSYVKPSSDPLQTVAGISAANISNQRVINNCINISPVSIITSPGKNASFNPFSDIYITANASDTDGSVRLVEFYNGSEIMGSVSAPPYSFVWSAVDTGTYSLTVIVTDNLNAKTVSDAVLISVIDGKSAVNIQPFVEISNPQLGSTFNELSAITIEAIASDPDGTIAKIEFFNGHVKLTELTSAPYTYTWENITSGNYTITAIATDNANDTTISAPVEFVVKVKSKSDAKPESVNLFPNPNNGHFSISFINSQSQKSEIVITDLGGKQIYYGPISKEEILKEFDLSEVISGTYVLIIKDKELLITKKFIINK